MLYFCLISSLSGDKSTTGFRFGLFIGIDAFRSFVSVSRLSDALAFDTLSFCSVSCSRSSCVSGIGSSCVSGITDSFGGCVSGTKIDRVRLSIRLVGLDN